MFNITFLSTNSDIAAISTFKDDIVHRLNISRRTSEQETGYGNIPKEIVILAVATLCATIKQEEVRGETLVYAEYDALYDFETIRKTLGLHNLELKDFFNYFKIFTT